MNVIFSLLCCTAELISPPHENYDCHGSSIVEAQPGVLCTVWKGGFGKGKCNGEMKEKVGIWLTRQENGKWSDAEEIVDAKDSLCWAPVIAKGPDGELLLFYRIGPSPRQVVAFLKRSFDAGRTWSDPEMLPAGILGPIRSKPLIDEKGNIICGTSTEAGSPEDEYKATACYVEISPDNGQTWSKFGPIEIPGKRFGGIEPALFYSGDSIRMVCRDRSMRLGEQGWIWSATSSDGGKTWSPLEKLNLPNPDSGMEVLQLKDGRLLMAYNHSHTQRSPLNLALSSDGGNTWHPSLVLEETSGEFPSMCLSSDGLIHIVYAHSPESSQRKIKHVTIDPKEL